MELELSVRARFDELADVIAVARPWFEDREDDELGRPFFQLAVEDPGLISWHSHICLQACLQARKR